MERTIKKIIPLSDQVKNHASQEDAKEQEYEGNIAEIISTGSTLLDLAISGGRVRGGGLPSGILVEIFGPFGSGKTVLLCEVAGAIQRQGGQVMFHDPEARLNKQFARQFDLDTDILEYSTPDTVPEVFSSVREWNPKARGINGIFADSLAALSTEMELSDKDQYGMRRAKEFSEELRKTCRVLVNKNLLMVCSNQVRQNLGAGPYGQKYISPGGESIGFYSSLRLRTNKPSKIKENKKIAGKDVTRVVGVEVEVEVFKSSVWKPYRTAPLTIIFDYGIDDIRQNLQFVKDYTENKMYTVAGEGLHASLDKSIQMVEENELVNILRNEVIDLWGKIEQRFVKERKPKR